MKSWLAARSRVPAFADSPFLFPAASDSGYLSRQVFARDLIVRAYARVQARGLRITDDAAAVEGLGHPIALLENPHPNPKVTTPADLDYLEFLRSRSR